jgi:hypothetical protein
MASNLEDEAFNILDRHINKKKTTTIVSISKVTKTKTTKQLNHEVIDYKTKKYVVCCVPFNDEHKMFIIDFDKKDDVINKSWHFAQDGSYIGRTVYINDIKK